MNGDVINALFEFGGSIVTWMNVQSLYRARGYAGVNLSTVAFFTFWGAWNLYYYPSLGQWWSYHAALALCGGNATWFVLALRFGRKP